MSESDFRPLTDRELQALRRMLAVPFEGRVNFTRQVDGLQLRERDQTLFELLPAGTEGQRPGNATFGVPIECTYRDQDGAVVYVDLFADQDGSLAELELWKPDGTAVVIYFADADLIVKPLEKPRASSGGVDGP